MENDWSGPKVKILNWGKANFDGIRQELSKVNWGSLWEAKGCLVSGRLSKVC